MVANCWGIADVNGDDAPIGSQIDLSQINICQAPAPGDEEPPFRQGQRNIHIVPRSQGAGGQIRFGFLAGDPVLREPSKIVLNVARVPQAGAVDTAVLSVLNSSRFRALPLHPAANPPKSVSLARNPHKCHGRLAEIICEATEIIEDLIEDLEHLLGIGHGSGGIGTRLRLSLPPNGLQPLLFEADFDPTDDIGSVQVFDVVQTDEASARDGGFRLAVVTVA